MSRMSKRKLQDGPETKEPNPLGAGDRRSSSPRYRPTEDDRRWRFDNRRPYDRGARSPFRRLPPFRPAQRSCSQRILGPGNGRSKARSWSRRRSKTLPRRSWSRSRSRSRERLRSKSPLNRIPSGSSSFRREVRARSLPSCSSLRQSLSPRYRSRSRSPEKRSHSFLRRPRLMRSRSRTPSSRSSSPRLRRSRSTTQRSSSRSRSPRLRRSRSTTERSSSRSRTPRLSRSRSRTPRSSSWSKSPRLRKSRSRTPRSMSKSPRLKRSISRTPWSRSKSPRLRRSRSRTRRSRSKNLRLKRSISKTPGSRSRSPRMRRSRSKTPMSRSRSTRSGFGSPIRKVRRQSTDSSGPTLTNENSFVDSTNPNPSNFISVVTQSSTNFEDGTATPRCQDFDASPVRGLENNQVPDSSADDLGDESDDLDPDQVPNSSENDLSDDLDPDYQPCHRVNVEVYNSREAGKRNCKKTDYCLFCCGKYDSKISKHILAVHLNEEKVKSVRNMPIGSRERKAALALIQNEGNFNHNAKVLQKGQGNLIVFRRPTNAANANASHYLPCEYCKAFYHEDHLWLHAKSCYYRPGVVGSEKNYVRNGRMMFAPFLKIGEKTEHELDGIISRMKETAQNPGLRAICEDDILVREFGECLTDKFGTLEEQRRKDKDNISTN